MKVLIVVVASLMALLVGVTSALVGGLLALLIVIMVVPVVLLIFDYRIGVAAMAIVLPFASSPLLPRAQGLDVTNYLVALSLLSLLVPRLLGRQPMVLVPRAVVWLFLAPVTMGIIVAWPHVREGVSYMRMGDVGDRPDVEHAGAQARQYFEVFELDVTANS